MSSNFNKSFNTSPWPRFDPEDPALWFRAVDSVFDIYEINNIQRYLTVRDAIRPIDRINVRDVLIRPMDDQSYFLLKKELIRSLNSNGHQNTVHLLENEAMRDEKPSQYLERLQMIAGTSMPGLVRAYWIKGLPMKLQKLMEIKKNKPIMEAVELADIIWEIIRENEMRDAIERNTMIAVLENSHRMMEIQKSLECLTRQVQEIKVAVDRFDDQSSTTSSFIQESRDEKFRWRRCSFSSSDKTYCKSQETFCDDEK